jgi:hypothetical protein
MTPPVPNPPGRPTPPAAGPPRTPNPWIGVRFVCAGQYIRVYRRPESPVYLARCPKCAKCVRFRVGQGGSNARMFDVSC